MSEHAINYILRAWSQRMTPDNVRDVANQFTESELTEVLSIVERNPQKYLSAYQNWAKLHPPK